MIRSRSHSLPRGGLILILLILAFHFSRVSPGPSRGEKHASSCSDVFVQIEGDVCSPGVYGFRRAPDIWKLINHAGGVDRHVVDKVYPTDQGVFSSGSKVEVRNYGGTLILVEEQMSAFYKITLGVPISLNRESAEGLTAIKGVGPKTAAAIVREREQRGGFKRLKGIMDVKGIGPVTYRKIRCYLKL